MANDIDPITGLPPMGAYRPQTEALTQKLTNQLLVGSEQFTQAQNYSSEGLRRELEILMARDIKDDYTTKKISELQQRIGQVGSLEAQLAEANRAYAEKEGWYKQREHLYQGRDRGEFIQQKSGELRPFRDRIVALQRDLASASRYRTADVASSLRARLASGAEGISAIQGRITQPVTLGSGKGTITYSAEQAQQRLDWFEANPALKEQNPGEYNKLLAARSPLYTQDEAMKRYAETGEGRLVTGALDSLYKEELLLGDISSLRLTAEQEMSRELQRRMEGITEEEGMARGIIGESGAKRGLLRSTFTRSGIEQSALREQERIGSERVGVQSQIMNLRNAERKLVSDIEAQREQMLTIKNIREIEQLERQRSLLVEANLRNNITQALANAQISAVKKAQMMGTITSIASTAVMAYAVSGGGAAAACWVARAVFGIDNIKWVFARTYVVQDSPRWFYNLYIKYGERFAKKVEKSKALKLILKPIFNYFAFRGRKKWHL